MTNYKYFFLHRVYKMTLCHIIITCYILYWWSYDSDRHYNYAIPVLVRSPWHKVDKIYAGFTDQRS